MLWLIPRISEQPKDDFILRTLDPSGELLSLTVNNIVYRAEQKSYVAYEGGEPVIVIPETQAFTFINQRRFRKVSQRDYLREKAQESEANRDLMAQLQREFPEAIDSPSPKNPPAGFYS